MKYFRMNKSLALILALAMLLTLFPFTALAEEWDDSNVLPKGYIDTSNDGLAELLNQQQEQISLFAASSEGKTADLVFVIDSTASMSNEINNVKLSITKFAQSLEAQGVSLRIGIVEYRDIQEDGLDSTVVHKLNYSPWLSNTTQMVDKLSSISVGGGGDYPETVIDALGYLVDDNTMLWSSSSYKFAIVLTDASYKINNRHGYANLQEVTDELASRHITTSVITTADNYNTYKTLADTTGGELADINSNFDTVLSSMANRILDVALKPSKAIYVLPGYMGSRLYGNDNKEVWANEAIIASELAKAGLIGGARSVLELNVNGENPQVHDGMDNFGFNSPDDLYGSLDTYKSLISKLESEFGKEYDVIFFSYNWLADLNDEAIELQSHINSNGYDSVIFVTHSTGGLLASTYISNSRDNKLKVDKAILIAPPLFGTYASLEPLEFGKNDFLEEKLNDRNWIEKHVAFSGIKAIAVNSPTTYQLLPSIEYLKLIPQIYKDDIKGTAVTTADRYYEILNQSSNINPLLTNGSKRSHEALRRKLGDVISLWEGNVVSALQEVDTVLIGTSKGHMTPAIASYKGSLFGGTKIDDIIFKKDGDGTILNISSFAMSADNKHVLKYKDFKDAGYDHTALVTEKVPIDYVCDYIKGIATASSPTVSLMSDEAGMETYIKLRYYADKDVEVNIFDDKNDNVVKISLNETFGLEKNKFEYLPITMSTDETDAILYMPREGYKIVFSHGNVIDIAIEFYCEVSTLVADGWNDVSVINSANVTLDNGILATLDGITGEITADNLSSKIDGNVTTYYTEWDLPKITKVNHDDVMRIEPVGNHATQVLPLLSWNSSDDNIIEIASDGTITAKSFGKVTISATDGNKATTGEVVVVQEATSLTLANITMDIDERVLIKPQFIPATATETDLVYTVNNNDIVSINESGVILALKAGTATVTAMTSYGVQNEFDVIVLDDNNYAVQSISITPTSISVQQGKSTTLKALFRPENASNKDVHWFVDDASILKLTSKDDTATITGLKEGSSKVTVVSDDGGYSDECVIKVVRLSNSSGGSNSTNSLTAPIANVQSGEIVLNTPVTLTTNYKDAIIYYTIDGTNPTQKSMEYT